MPSPVVVFSSYSFDGIIKLNANRVTVTRDNCAGHKAAPMDAM